MGLDPEMRNRILSCVVAAEIYPLPPPNLLAHPTVAVILHQSAPTTDFPTVAQDSGSFVHHCSEAYAWPLGVWADGCGLTND